MKKATMGDLIIDEVWFEGRFHTRLRSLTAEECLERGRFVPTKKGLSFPGCFGTGHFDFSGQEPPDFQAFPLNGRNR